MDYELSVEDKKWNKMWDLWCNEEAKSPYAEIMDYCSEVNNGGHAQYFSNLGDLGELEENIKVLFTSLPEVFIERLKKAYELYLEDEFGEETEIVMEECDDIFYDNEELIDGILKEYSATLEV